jgi:hypothetical protein
MLIFCPGIPPSDPAKRAFYWKQVAMMRRSALKTMPRAKVIYATSQTSTVDMPESVVLRCDLPADTPLMVAQCRIWQKIAETASEPFVVVDQDLLFLRPLAEIFSGEFDIGLTFAWEKNLPYPINAGVLICDPRRVPLSPFIDWIVSELDGYSKELQAWYGDQQALSSLYPGLKAGDPMIDNTIEFRGARVRLFDAETYNLSPPYGFQYDQRVPASAYILHFKGDRKRFMEPYFTKFVK